MLPRNRFGQWIAKHGHTKIPNGTPTYISWMCMKRRCYDPSVNDYDKYGGRGISVDSRWMAFELFLEDMGERPLGKWLDRVNVDGNYQKDNCRWVTPKESARNRSNNRWVEVAGKKVTIAEAAEITGIPISKLYNDRTGRILQEEEKRNESAQVR